MFRLSNTSLGKARIPIKDSDKKYGIVEVKVIDKNGHELTAEFALIDLLNSLNHPDEHTTVVEPVHYVGKIEPRRAGE